MNDSGIREKVIFQKVRRVVRRLGIVKSIILLTLISTILSILLTIFLVAIYRKSLNAEFLSISIIVPLIISPTITITLFQLLNSLDDAERKLHVLSMYDELTGVFNRRYFFQSMNSEFNRVQINNNDNFALLMLDIDYFKKINDVHGHLAGDKVLHDLAERCSQNIRENDILARYGGEEFIIFLSGVNKQKGFDTAERIREKIEQTPFVYNEKSINCTVSIGIAFFHSHISELNALVSRADQALYAAKKRGRNCVVLDS